jgi:uncharacterized protein
MRRSDTEVVEQFFSTLEAMEMEAFFALWAEEGHQEMPFAPQGFPMLLDGKEAIRRQYGGLPDTYGRMLFPGLVVRPLEEQGWVFAEYQGEIEKLSGGSYNNRYCGLFHIEDGQIKLFREYFNPIILQEAFGTALNETFHVVEEP